MADFFAYNKLFVILNSVFVPHAQYRHGNRQQPLTFYPTDYFFAGIVVICLLISKPPLTQKCSTHLGIANFKYYFRYKKSYIFIGLLPTKM